MLTKKILCKYLTPLKPIPTPLKPLGNLDAKIQCILFDIYGTLFISGSGDISIARQSAQGLKKIGLLLKHFGIDTPAITVIKTFFDTIEAQHQVLKNQGNMYPEVKIDEIWMDVLNLDTLEAAREFALEYELIVNPVYPMPHLREMLEACKSAKIFMGIISNAQFYTPYLFQWFLGADPEELGFNSELTLFSHQFGCAKPSAYLFETARKRLEKRGITPERVLYLGNDMLNDIYPAAAAGFKTALFAGDARSLRLREDVPECTGLSADLVITDLKQIRAYLY
jgi:putative hydrolase of the HAD superfamily